MRSDFLKTLKSVRYLLKSHTRGGTCDVADTRIAESIAALRRFVAEHGSLPTAESWTEAAMRPSEKTIRRRFGSFREAIQRAALT